MGHEQELIIVDRNETTQPFTPLAYFTNIEGGDDLYSRSRTQRIAKCWSSTALRKFIFSLILAR